MTRRLVLTITDEEHALLAAVSAREGGSVEQWLLKNALGVAEIAADDLGIRFEPRRSPRRDEDAEYGGTSARMVRCPHCQMETRDVATCDNCEREL